MVRFLSFIVHCEFSQFILTITCFLDVDEINGDLSQDSMNSSAVIDVEISSILQYSGLYYITTQEEELKLAHDGDDRG